MADPTDILAEDIRIACCSEDGTFRWDGYLEALWQEIQTRIESEKKENEERDESDENIFNFDLEAINTSGKGERKANKAKCKEIIALYQKMETMVLARGVEMGERLGNAWCRLHSLREEQPHYELEYWLRPDGDFMHPNGVRYFLYHLQTAIGKRLEAEKAEIEKLNLGIRNLTGSDATKIDKKRDTFRDVYKDYENSLNKLYKCSEHMAYRKVLEQCSVYVGRLIQNYEVFYSSYNELLEDFKEECRFLEEEFGKTKGTIQAYVCVDQDCREKIFGMLRNRKSFQQTGTGLSFRIFELMQRTIQYSYRNHELFVQLKEHWIGNLEREYSDLLDMNILHAIDMEEFCKTGKNSDAMRMESWIEDVKQNLIEPFLQYSKESGEQQGISICCYNDELLYEHGYYMDVVRWLQDQENVHDSFYCSRYQLMFYRSFVGLDAHEVLDYIHADEDGGRDGGETFLSYEDALAYMGKNAMQNTQITPHIDKGWHSYLKLPDSDSLYQQQKELEIAQAFLYAVLEGKFRKKGNGAYDYTPESGRIEFPNLMECHHFLYDNNWQVRLLNDELHKSSEAKRSGQQNFTFGLIDKYQGGIFQVLLQYFKEIELGKQDRFMYQLLLEAVWLFVMNSLEGEFNEKLAECRSKLKAEWNKITSENRQEARLQPFNDAAISFLHEKKICTDEG